jgi:NAD(P)-dependent dehydrogenase (short-subunit alcohol dehydrogenase family)
MGSINKTFGRRARSGLVTGGSRELDLQIAEALSEQGAKILLSSWQAADLEQAQRHPAGFRIQANGSLQTIPEGELCILAASVGTRSERQQRSHLNAFSRGRIGGRMRVGET